MSTLHSDSDFLLVERLIGSVTKEKLSTLDWYTYKNVGVILPATGPCYAKAINHKHPSYSFIIHFDDLYRLQTQGKIIDAIQNTFSALSPRIEHNECGGEKFVRYASVFIKKEFFEAQWNLYDKNGTILVFNGDNYRVLPLLKTALKDFMIEYENLLPGREKLLEALEYKVTHSIIRSIFSLEENTTLVNQRTNLDNAIEYIHGHFGERITLGELAAIANLSESHFIRVFKESTGKTPKEYLLLIRLDKAKKMLQNSNMKNAEIALDCGFNNPSHFSNTFNKHFKVSPFKYRSALK